MYISQSYVVSSFATIAIDSVLTKLCLGSWNEHKQCAQKSIKRSIYIHFKTINGWGIDIANVVDLMFTYRAKTANA